MFILTSIRNLTLIKYHPVTYPFVHLLSMNYVINTVLIWDTKMTKVVSALWEFTITEGDKFRINM